MSEPCFILETPDEFAVFAWGIVRRAVENQAEAKRPAILAAIEAGEHTHKMATNADGTTTHSVILWGQLLAEFKTVATPPA